MAGTTVGSTPDSCEYWSPAWRSGSLVAASACAPGKVGFGNVRAVVDAGKVISGSCPSISRTPSYRSVADRRVPRCAVRRIRVHGPLGSRRRCTGAGVLFCRKWSVQLPLVPHSAVECCTGGCKRSLTDPPVHNVVATDGRTPVPALFTACDTVFLGGGARHRVEKRISGVGFAGCGCRSPLVGGQARVRTYHAQGGAPRASDKIPGLRPARRRRTRLVTLSAYKQTCTSACG